jgi:hypothetical protein
VRGVVLSVVVLCGLTLAAAGSRRDEFGWVTSGEHGFDLWEHASGILGLDPPGREVRFPPNGTVPPGSFCA